MFGLHAIKSVSSFLLFYFHLNIRVTFQIKEKIYQDNFGNILNVCINSVCVDLFVVIEVFLSKNMACLLHLFMSSFALFRSISVFFIGFSYWFLYLFFRILFLFVAIENGVFYSNFSEKAMAPHSSTLAWKIPWMEEPGRLQSMGSWRVGQDGATSLSLFIFMHWRRKWQPTPVLLPGESQGRGSLVGCRLWGRIE